MQSHLILMLLAFTIALVNAKTLLQFNDDNNFNEEPTEILHSNRYLIEPEIFQEILLQLLKNERNKQREYDRLQTIAKRAKAIVKGDPREFMG